MYSISARIEQASGLLLFKDFETFIYICTKCQCEYLTGVELEQHIFYYHQDEKKCIDGIFVNDGVLDASLEVPFVSIEPIISESLIGETHRESNELINENIPHEMIKDSSSSIDNESASRTEHSLCSTSTQRLSSSDDASTEGQRVSSKHAEPNRSKSKRKIITDTVYCDMCPGTVFTSIESLKNHLRRHSKNQVLKRCSICQKKPRNLEKHMKMIHSESKPYKCDYCDSAFKSNMNRVIHIRTHTGERPFLCATCGKSFKSQDTKKKHHIRMHDGKLPHLCSACGRSFLIPSQLQEHTYSFHSDVRPYICEFCGHSYSTRKYLRKHKQSHGEKIHSCKYCEKKFKTTETRRWHERTVHKAV